MRSTLWSRGCQRPPSIPVHLWIVGDPGHGLDGAALATVCSRIALLLASGHGAVVTKQLLLGAYSARRTPLAPC